MHGIHLDTFLQYFPAYGLLPTCSGISRYRDRFQNSPQTAKSRKHFSPSRQWSNRVIKTAVGQHLVCTTTYQSPIPIGHLLHRTVGASKLATVAGSGTSQKFILICQLFMESQHSKCIESIKTHFYNIPSIPGSLHLVLTSPDAEIAPKISQ